MVGSITVFYDIKEVLMAMGITVALVLALSIFAMQTKFDITSKGGYLFAACFVLMLFGILFVVNYTIYLVYCCFAVLLFSLYIIYDIQLIMGDRKYGYSQDSYIPAAINLYMDIINIFLILLSLLGLSD